VDIKIAALLQVFGLSVGSCGFANVLTLVRGHISLIMFKY